MYKVVLPQMWHLMMAPQEKSRGHQSKINSLWTWIPAQFCHQIIGYSVKQEVLQPETDLHL